MDKTEARGVIDYVPLSEKYKDRTKGLGNFKLVDQAVELSCKLNELLNPLVQQTRETLTEIGVDSEMGGFYEFYKNILRDALETLDEEQLLAFAQEKLKEFLVERIRQINTGGAQDERKPEINGDIRDALNNLLVLRNLPEEVKGEIRKKVAEFKPEYLP